MCCPAAAESLYEPSVKLHVCSCDYGEYTLPPWSGAAMACSAAFTCEGNPFKDRQPSFNHILPTAAPLTHVACATNPVTSSALDDILAHSRFRHPARACSTGQLDERVLAIDSFETSGPKESLLAVAPSAIRFLNLLLWQLSVVLIPPTRSLPPLFRHS